MAEAKEGEEHRSLNELASAIAECVDRHEQPPYAVQEWSNVGSCGESNLRHPAERNMCFCPFFFFLMLLPHLGSLVDTFAPSFAYI